LTTLLEISELRKWANSWNHGIPKKRAIILSGKAGIGKTSSAYALAKDFGWAAIELNTSDARNATTIKNVATFGAINETFDDQGRFISSRDGGRKLIILDEADNLYEKIERKDQTGTDFSDKGGKKAIVDTIKITLIRFYDPYPSAIFNLLRRICNEEKIAIDQKALQKLADRCKGDIRSAVNDLQSICLDNKQVDSQALDVLGYRDREKVIFDALREIFKTRNIQSIRNSMSRLDKDPPSVLLWINENLPIEYRDINDVVRGYDALTKADIFLGRTMMGKNYGLWSYASDLMNGGVATAKTRSYPNEKYNFPSWLREIKANKSSWDVRNSVINKMQDAFHQSSIKSREVLLTYFIPMFKGNTRFAIAMKQKFGFTESEIKYLLGKTHAHKLKEILHGIETVHVKPTPEEVTTSDEKEKHENIQQSLFDFR